MSRMMPNAVVNRLVQELDIEAPEIARQLPDMMALGLQKIYSYQHEDGSWGYWSGGKNVYITAYVLQGLTMLQQGGYEIDQAVMDRGFVWLEANNRLESDIRIRAYAPYVLAINGRGDETEILELYDRRAELDTFGLAAVAIALDKIGRRDAADVVLDELEAMAVETPTTASWPLAVRDRWHWDFYHWRTMASTDKHTAMALEALALLRPESPLASKAARWLMENRTGYGYFSRGWSSTQATSFAVLALTDYIVASGELWAEYDWTVAFDGETVASGRVDAMNIKRRIPVIVVTGASMAPGDHVLTLAKQGDGTLFYTAIGRLSLYYDGFAPTAAEGYGLQIKREYTPIAGRSGTGGWTVGDVVNVRITVETSDALHYLIIEDPLPAGLEGLNESLETESSRVPSQPPEQWWRWRGYERKEVRDDRVDFFATYLAPGTHTFDYAARAVTPGVFSSRPAEAYAMYRPEVWGRSASDQVVIDRRQIAARPVLSGDFDRDCHLTAFDASLVAAQWPDGGARDVDGNGRVDVADIATAAGRRGLSCGDGVPLPPGAAGDVAIQLRAPDRIEAGRAFDLEVLLVGDAEVGGYDLLLDLPDGAFEIIGAAPGEDLAEANLLGPIVSGNTVRFGAYALSGAPFGGETVLARLRLRATRTGDAGVHVSRAQVVTDHGGEYTVTAEGTTVSPVPWTPKGRLYLPFTERGAPVR